MADYYTDYSAMGAEESYEGAYEGGCGCDEDCSCPICNKKHQDKRGLWVLVAIIIVMLLLIVWYRAVGKDSNEGPITFLCNKISNFLKGL